MSAASSAAWFSETFRRRGLAAHSRYPNEELIRFLARHYFPLPPEARRGVRMLEAGCGAGANLWMIAREGFEAHGIEQSPEGVALSRKMLDAYQVRAAVQVADMTAIPYPAAHFDLVFDVFASYCLDERGFEIFLGEVWRLLRPGGRFFSYTPSKASDAFRHPGPSGLLDGSTLDGIQLEGSHFAGNLYPFRFISRAEYAAALGAHGLQADFCETIGRTYGGGKEYFEFVVISAVTPPA